MLDLTVKLGLLRPSASYEVDDVVRVADISFQSELATLKRLSDATRRLGRRHSVVVVVDAGGLREGCNPREALAVARFVDSSFLDVVGVATNYGCPVAAGPSRQDLDVFYTPFSKYSEHWAVQCPLSLWVAQPSYRFSFVTST